LRENSRACAEIVFFHRFLFCCKYQNFSQIKAK
jgi:hypothetical protein